MEKNKKLFANVYGYEDVKEELIRVKEWICNEKYLKNPKIQLPKGILFYGQPGNGKTLFLREYAESFNAPTYIINGDCINVCQEIEKKFSSAREEKFAVIIIDEIDLIMDRSEKVERCIQQNLDGVNNKGNFIVLATTNHIDNLSNAILRPGRFDKKIEIDDPDYESRIDLIKNFIKDLNGIEKEVDYHQISKVIGGSSGAEIKAICNDTYLRCDGVFTTENLERSYDRVVNNDYSNKEVKFKGYTEAIHEAGHTVMALYFKNNWEFFRTKYTSSGAITEIRAKDEKRDSLEKRYQSIMIGLSGYLAEELVFGYHEIGSFNDLEKVQDYLNRLIERNTIKGISNLVPEDYYNTKDKHWTPKLFNKNYRLTNRLKLKLQRKTKRILRKHKNDIIKIADLMVKDGYVNRKNINELGLSV